MTTLVIMEIKKMMFKKRIALMLALSMYLAFISIHDFSASESYADVFSKVYGLSPLVGMIMFTMVSSSYVMEKRSGMDELIKAGSLGRKKIAAAKSIAGGISCSLASLLVFASCLISGLLKTGFSHMEMPVSSLWYFAKSDSSLTVIQMIAISATGIVVGSFFFAQLGLFLSSSFRNSAPAFLLGGLAMGSSYMAEGFARSAGVAKYLGLTPLWLMMNMQLVRYKVPFAVFMTGTLLSGAFGILMYRTSKKNFLKEH